MASMAAADTRKHRPWPFLRFFFSGWLFAPNWNSPPLLFPMVICARSQVTSDTSDPTQLVFVPVSRATPGKCRQTTPQVPPPTPIIEIKSNLSIPSAVNSESVRSPAAFLLSPFNISDGSFNPSTAADLIVCPDPVVYPVQSSRVSQPTPVCSISLLRATDTGIMKRGH